MAEHKVKSQSPFKHGKTVWSRQVTLTCTCGKGFTGHYTGRRGYGNEVLERRALEDAEQVFRAHIPIR